MSRALAKRLTKGPDVRMQLASDRTRGFDLGGAGALRMYRQLHESSDDGVRDLFFTLPDGVRVVMSRKDLEARKRWEEKGAGLK
jgi:hypothetical protein